MSDIKMSDDDLNSWLRNGTNGHIKNNHIVADRMDTLVAQNLALKAALEKVKAEQELERSEAGHSGYSETWLISSNALVALEGVGDE